MSSGSNGAGAKRTFVAAVRLVAVFVVASLAALVLALVWVSDCKSGGGDHVLERCGAARRYFLAIGPSLILFVGGAWAFVQMWRGRGRWWIWQGAGWFLLMLMMVMLTMTAPMAFL